MTLAAPRDEVVAEVLVHLRPPARVDGAVESRDRAFAFLHRTLDVGGVPAGVPGADVRILLGENDFAHLPEAFDRSVCADELGFPDAGTCYGPLGNVVLEAGEPLRLEISLPDGGTLTSVTTPPGRLALRVPSEPACALAPLETLELTWSRSEGASAYVIETAIRGLADHFEPLGVDVPDPLQIIGLALSADDTTLVFPAEVGVFDRGDLEREVAVLLQEGLPAGTSADVVVAAVDENYVNWVRGGNFNPSGLVRIPSVEGDGTGFFGSAASAGTHVEVTSSPGTGLAPCGGG